MPFGYMGKILHVNLGAQEHWVESPDDAFYRTYWGGRAVGLYYMLKKMKPHVDPLSKDNLLIFAAGLIAGSKAPAMNRFAVLAKSPLTGAQGEAEAGGFWGPELKRAGFDAVVIEGKAESPVYLWIQNGKVEIRDAISLWGKKTEEAELIIKRELADERIRIAQIGPAGEKMVRFANISNGLRHFNGRNGLGAVMGSKNLKAIAVRGVGTLEVSNPQKLTEIAREFAKKAMENQLVKDLREWGTSRGVEHHDQIGDLAVNNWTTTCFPGGKNLSRQVYKEYLKGTGSCYACPIVCKRVVEVRDQDIQVDPTYGGPEYEGLGALGPLCGIDDFRYVAKANEICNANTMDSISTGATIAFAMQCYHEGLLSKKDTDGLDLSFGNKESLLAMVQKIAKREGLGDILAEGSYRAAKIIGGGAERFVHHGKGQELPMHDPRLKVGVGLQYALADYGADHCKAAHDPFFASKESWMLQEAAGMGILEPVSTIDIGEKKVRLFKVLDIFNSFLDMIGACVFGYVFRSVGTLEDIQAIVRATTGWRTSWYEMMQAGERSINMARMFNVREGFSKKEDVLADVFYQNFKEGKFEGTGGINREDFAKALQMRYEMMGWDPDTGIPLESKLGELSLSWIVNKS